MASGAGELAEYGGGEARERRVVEGSRCAVTLRPCYFVNTRCRGASRDRITDACASGTSWRRSNPAIME